ncbi:MAG: ferritin family protein [Deltaproteobacteria bacterium]|nr:ferritin family protein [Deltaproteobacteria bacterium]
MNLDQYKKIIKFAIVGEIEAQEFYKVAADKVNDPYLKKMFEQFAKDEQGHEKILKGILSKDAINQYFNESTDHKVAETVDTPKLSTNMKPADAIALAMKKEEEAMKQYTDLAEACKESGQKKVFLDLASMERGHKLKMEKAFVDIGYAEVW